MLEAFQQDAGQVGDRLKVFVDGSDKKVKIKVCKLEPEGEEEKLDVTVLWNKAEGVSENPEDENRHEQIRAKTTRKER